MDSKLYNLIKDMDHCPVRYPDINYLRIPVTLLQPNEDNAQKFNQILAELKLDDEYSIITRTPSGGICKTVDKLFIPSYDYIYTPNSAEITILDIQGMWRIQFRSGIYEDDDKKISGRGAFRKFNKLLEKDGINLEDYAVENGLDIKATIEKPLIGMDDPTYKDMIFEGVNHIDFHNSYPAGLVNTHPEFYNVIKTCYDKRKEDGSYKAVLNFSIGFMQSKWCGYKYAALSRDAIKNNNDRIKALANELKTAGRMILSFNTDGIWYSGEVYHGEGEGNDLGQWSNDHINCKFRMKSDGAYEYIENGKYHPVVRGYTKLDRIKDRENWDWGDIYQADIITFYITENGIKYKENTLWEKEDQ